MIWKNVDPGYALQADEPEFRKSIIICSRNKSSSRAARSRHYIAPASSSLHAGPSFHSCNPFPRCFLSPRAARLLFDPQFTPFPVVFASNPSSPLADLYFSLRSLPSPRNSASHSLARLPSIFLSAAPPLLESAFAVTAPFHSPSDLLPRRFLRRVPGDVPSIPADSFLLGDPPLMHLCNPAT